MDQERIQKAVYELLQAVGEDPERSGLKETPARVARMYAEIFSGLEEDPKQYLKIFEEDPHHRNWCWCGIFPFILCVNTTCFLLLGKLTLRIFLDMEKLLVF